MATIVGVHGAFHQLWGPHEVANRWIPAIRDGLWHVSSTIDPDEIDIAFYGDVFRPNVVDGRPTDEDLLTVSRDAGLTLSLIHISEPKRLGMLTRMPSAG